MDSIIVCEGSAIGWHALNGRKGLASKIISELKLNYLQCSYVECSVELREFDCNAYFSQSNSYIM